MKGIGLAHFQVIPASTSSKQLRINTFGYLIFTELLKLPLKLSSRPFYATDIHIPDLAKTGAPCNSEDFTLRLTTSADQAYTKFNLGKIDQFYYIVIR